MMREEMRKTRLRKMASRDAEEDASEKMLSRPWIWGVAL